jgi:hypothetical protein
VSLNVALDAGLAELGERCATVGAAPIQATCIRKLSSARCPAQPHSRAASTLKGTACRVEVIAFLDANDHDQRHPIERPTVGRR